MTSSAPKRTLLSWSSGKDAAWALHVLRARGDEVAALLTTVQVESGRVGIHEVDGALVAAQAAAVGLPLIRVPLPWPCPNATYEAALRAALAGAQAEYGITHVAFGDLYLEDIRAYRETLLAPTGLIPLFPLWGRPTAALAHAMTAGGMQARVVTVDLTRLPAAFAGRAFDSAFLGDLPPEVDPCGENGEFHTFATNAPGFAHPVPVEVGPGRVAGGFAHAELTLETG